MEHVDELIAAHALHALDADDERRVVEHLASCERCRLRLLEMQDVAATLAYGAPPAPAPADLRQRVLAAALAEGGATTDVVPAEARAERTPRPTRPRVAWWPRFAAVAVPVLAAAVVGLAIWNVSLRDRLSSVGDPLRQGRAVSLGTIGNAVVATGGQTTLYSDVPRAPTGKTYEAWLIRNGKPIPVGLFAGGPDTSVKLDGRARPGDTIAVTLEPAHGPHKVPTTKPLGAGELT